jgi:HK97 family phage portal protein
MNCLFHPLVGLSPIFACGLAAMQAMNIQTNSEKFFKNMSRPSGVLTAPAQISESTAQRLKDHWEKTYGGDNIGKVAVLGDGLKYEQMTTTPVDAQMVEQLQMSAKQIAATVHVPAYMVGADAIPPNNNVEALQIMYFSQCLQSLIKAIEDCLDEGLGLPYVTGKTLGTQFNLDDLLRMDTATLTQALKEQVTAGITSPNEARQRINLPPATGGDSPMMQQQQFSLEALSERDQAKPFAKPAAPPPAAPAPTPEEDEQRGYMAELLTKDILRKMMEPV